MSDYHLSFIKIWKSKDFRTTFRGYVINFKRIQKAMSCNERYVKQLVICHNLSYLSVLHFSLKCSSFKFELESKVIYERVFRLLRLASSMVMYDTRRDWKITPLYRTYYLKKFRLKYLWLMEINKERNAIFLVKYCITYIILVSPIWADMIWSQKYDMRSHKIFL